MENLCRACGNELDVAELCEACSEPIRWRCNACLGEKDSTHVHSKSVQYVLAH